MARRRQQVNYSQSKQTLNPQASPVSTMYTPEQAPIQFGGDRGENIKNALASINNELLDPQIKREQANVERGWAKKAYETKIAIENEVSQAGILHSDELTDDGKKKALFAIEGKHLQGSARGFQNLYSKVQNQMRYDWSKEISDANTARYHSEQLTLMQEAIGTVYANPALNDSERAAETFGVVKMYSSHIENGAEGAANWLMGKISQDASIGKFDWISLLSEVNPETGGRLMDSKKHMAAAGTALKKYQTFLDAGKEDWLKTNHVNSLVGNIARGIPVVVSALNDPSDKFASPLLSKSKVEELLAVELSKITFDEKNEDNNMLTLFGLLSDNGLKHPSSPMVLNAMNNFTQGAMVSSDENVAGASLEHFEKAFKTYEVASQIKDGGKDVLGLSEKDIDILESYRTLKSALPEAKKSAVIQAMKSVSSNSESSPSVKIGTDEKDAINNAFPNSVNVYAQTERFKRLKSMLRAAGSGVKEDSLTDQVLEIMEKNYMPVEFPGTSEGFFGMGSNKISYISQDIKSSGIQERTFVDFVNEKYGEGHYLTSNPQNPTNSFLLFSTDSPMPMGYAVSVETLKDYQRNKYRNEVYDNN